MAQARHGSAPHLDSRGFPAFGEKVRAILPDAMYFETSRAPVAPVSTAEASKHEEWVRVCMLSGEILVRAEDVSNVRELKQQLHQKGLPSRFQQRMILAHDPNGAVLDDASTVHPGMCIQMYIVPFIDLSAEQQRQASKILFKAAECGKVGRVGKLLQQPVHPNVSPIALQLAAEGNHIEVVHLLLEAGADEELLPMTMALRAACKKKHVEVVQMLLEARADPNARVDGHTAFDDALDVGHMEILRWLLFFGGPEEVRRDLSAAKPLHHAASRGCVEAVRRILEARFDPNVRDKKGKTPLHHAAAYGHVEATGELLRAGALAHIKDRAGCTALHCATHQGHEEVKLLFPSAAPRSKKPSKEPGKA